MNLNVVGYLIYLPISVALTVWVARTLSRNGRIFLSDVMGGDEKLADAVNHLLVVGFYLVNLGFVALYLKIGRTVLDSRELFDALSVKLGVVLLVLGVLHLTNVYVLNRIRRRGLMERDGVPPVGPQGWTAPAPQGWGPGAQSWGPRARAGHPAQHAPRHTPQQDRDRLPEAGPEDTPPVPPAGR